MPKPVKTPDAAKPAKRARPAVIARDEKGHFLPGQTANIHGLGGRPKDMFNITARMRSRCATVLPDGRTYGDKLAEDIWHDALFSDDASVRTKARAELIDRLEGKAVARTENADAGTWTDLSVSEVSKERLKAAFQILRGGEAEQA